MGVRFRDGSPEQLFHVLERRHRAAVDILLARYGLSDIGQPVILTILSQQENGTISSQKELAKKLRVSPTTVTISLKSMERDGYVKKLSDANDLRCKPISITEKGMEAARMIDHVFDVLDHGMYQDFSAEERETLASFYRRTIDNLEAVVAENTK